MCNASVEFQIKMRNFTNPDSYMLIESLNANVQEQ